MKKIPNIKTMFIEAKTMITNISILDSIVYWANITIVIALALSFLGGGTSIIFSRFRDRAKEVQNKKEQKDFKLKIAILENEALKAKEEIIKADARATEAKLELEKFKAPRNLTNEQQLRISDKLKQFAGIPFDLVTYPNDREPASLSKQIINILISSRWIYKPPKKSFLLGSATGIVIVINKNAPPKILEAADALVKALKSENIEARIGIGSTGPNIDIEIQVAKKP